MAPSEFYHSKHGLCKCAKHYYFFITLSGRAVILHGRHFDIRTAYARLLAHESNLTNLRRSRASPGAAEHTGRSSISTEYTAVPLARSFIIKISLPFVGLLFLYRTS